jgi:caa(3)-type oxidase, subunit IV
MTEKPVPISTYAGIFLALLILTGTTCAVSYLNLGRLNAVVAMTIAIIKALLVALYFMHLRYGLGIYRLVGLAALFWLGIMIVLTISDYLTRIAVAG